MHLFGPPKPPRLTSLRLAALSQPRPEAQQHNHLIRAPPPPPLRSTTGPRSRQHPAALPDTPWCPLTLRSRAAEQPDSSPMATTVDVPL